MTKFRKNIAFVLVFTFMATSCPVAANNNGSEKLISTVRKEVEAGNYDVAVSLLHNDLRSNPENGTTHYYLGLIRQKMGEDGQAIVDLEMAARFCPPEVIADLTRQVAESKGKKLPVLPKRKPAQSDWFGNLGAQISSFFSGRPIEQSPVPALPIEDQLLDNLEGMYRQAKRAIKGKGKKQQQLLHDYYRSYAATTMPMGQMQKLVSTSRTINAQSWASHPRDGEGVRRIRQAPGNTPQWDRWIARYKKSFQFILLKHLSQYAESEKRGRAACVFSVERSGRLRGHIYASTGSAALNKCLLQTVRDLDHSRILKFPANAKIDGFNFKMTWNFGKLLAYARYVKARKEYYKRRHEAALKALAELKKKKEEEARKAQQKKLLAEKRRRELARLKALPPVVKTKVIAKIIPKPKPVELKAKALKLSDVVLKFDNIDTKAGDAFKNIDDKTIMSWPDLNASQ